MKGLLMLEYYLRWHVQRDRAVFRGEVRTAAVRAIEAAIQAPLRKNNPPLIEISFLRIEPAAVHICVRTPAADVSPKQIAWHLRKESAAQLKELEVFQSMPGVWTGEGEYYACAAALPPKLAALKES